MYKNFFYDIGKEIIGIFKGRHILWHLLAIIITYIFVVSGIDWWFFVITRGDVANTLGISAGILGFIVPMVVSPALYIFGVFTHNKYKIVALKSMQAIIVTLIVVATYKAFTGRIEPAFILNTVTNDISGQFNFGFWRHGIFWGWPSSHTAVAFALSVFLALWYRHRKWIGVIAILYASHVAIGAGVSFHWLSDVVAGTIIGSLIGYVVYKNNTFDK